MHTDCKKNLLIDKEKYWLPTDTGEMIFRCMETAEKSTKYFRFLTETKTQGSVENKNVNKELNEISINYLKNAQSVNKKTINSQELDGLHHKVLGEVVLNVPAAWIAIFQCSKIQEWFPQIRS